MHTFFSVYQQVRAHSVSLCKALEIEDFNTQPAVFVSPPKWHLAHTTWFFETFLLQPFLPNYQPFHPQFGFLFNSYYQHEGKRVQRDHRGWMSRPTVAEVYEYRAAIDSAILQLDPEEPEIFRRLTLGIQHEQQHQELLVYDIKYILGHQPLFPSLDLGILQPQLGESGWIKIEEQLSEIGHSGSQFAFDNEGPRHRVFLNGSQISSQLVSQEDYLEFIEAGGYQQFSYWLDEGWSWLQAQNIHAPLYWQETGKEWWIYDLKDGLQPLKPQAPVQHISYYEADAYARFRAKRLPTEAEREFCHDQLLNHQLWEWTQSAYLPYPGYRAEGGALGEYNGKFMINQMVLRGGSVATPPGHLRATYRNFFHPDERWMYSGLRLAEDD
ncbi:MAG: ergothioneine biosynthesis protein EgtB [Acidobacteria bacterium]|nr:ergothioneine biosynthesis protein EgtB [Acidobacteriota bacterium]